MFTGLRISVGLAWLAIVAAEMLKADGGIGFIHAAHHHRAVAGLGDATAIDQAGGAIIAGAGVDAVQANHRPISPDG